MVSFHMAGRMSNKLQARSESVILGEWSPTPFPSLQQIGSFQWLAPFFRQQWLAISALIRISTAMMIRNPVWSSQVDVNQRSR